MSGEQGQGSLTVKLFDLWGPRRIFYCKLRLLPTALSPRRGAHPGGKLELERHSSTLLSS